jgi:transcriptional regulator with XRE-family HTH domain
VVPEVSLAESTDVDWRDDKLTRTTLKRVGSNLLVLRDKKGWTQEEAAHRCGIVSQQSFQQIEAAKVNVTLHTLSKLARGFGVDVRDLLK